MLRHTRPIVDPDALKNYVEELVDARLAERGVTVTEYTSTNPAPGVRRRTHNTWCASGRVDGAVHDGRGWRCTAAAWRLARAAGAKSGAPKNAAGRFDRDAKPDNDVDLAESMLRSAGLRGTR